MHIRRYSASRRAFTLIELLVVLLILAILLSIALPLYLSAIANSQKRTCRANMQSIANAVEAARVRMRAANYRQIILKNRTGIDVNPADAAIGALTDLDAVPECPNHGTYEVRRGNTGNATTFEVRCTVPDHGTFQPGVSSE